MLQLVLVASSLAFMTAAALAGPLQDAARDGDIDKVTKLLADGADANQNDESGTGLVAAAEGGYADVALALLAAGAQVDLASKRVTPLFAAVRAGNTDVVELLIAHGADVSLTDPSGNTALHAAAYKGITPVVIALLDAGADVTARNRLGIVPALVAGTQEHFEIVDLLRERGGLESDRIAPVSQLLAGADPEHGQELFDSLRCAHCHVFDDGPARNTPNLGGIVGNPKASSAWAKQHSEGLRRIEGVWTFEDLNVWLADPGRFAPGNDMDALSIEIHVPEVKDRADIIAYLRLQDDNPEPLP